MSTPRARDAFKPCGAAFDKLDEAFLRAGRRANIGRARLFVVREADAPSDELREAVAVAVAALTALPCETAFLGDEGLSERLQLWRNDDPAYLAREATLLRQTRDLEYLFLFHRDGRLRQAALEKIEEPLKSAWVVCALAWRLNDWAPQVREAARLCAERVLADTAPDILAQAAMALHARMREWARWGGNAAVLEAALVRPDVADRLADRLLSTRGGRGGDLLRQALRWEGMDRRLPELARGAALPGVRVVAFKTLLEGKASWPIGRSWEWVDKSYNIRRWTVTTASRPLTVLLQPLALIRSAASDRSALVRRVASQALVERRFDDSEIGDLAAIFAADRNRRVREPAEFVLQERAKRAALGSDGPAA